MCTNCTRAAAEPWHGFSSGCPGCRARSVARSPQFYAVRKSGVQDRHYRGLLEQMGTAHESVKAPAAADAAMREAAA